MGKYVRGSSSGSLAGSEMRTAESPKRRRRMTTPRPPERSVQTSFLHLRSRRILTSAPRAQPLPASSPSSAAAFPAAEVLVAFDEKKNEGFQRPTSDIESSSGRLVLLREARRKERDSISASGSWPTADQATTFTTEAEIEMFFQEAELQQALRFADKYNYDVIGDAPMDGRFEWVGIDLTSEAHNQEKK